MLGWIGNWLREQGIWLAGFLVVASLSVGMLAHPWSDAPASRTPADGEGVDPEMTGPAPGEDPAAPDVRGEDQVWIILDPGHGGVDGGAVANGLIEKNLTLDVGLRCRRILEPRGHRVLMTRDGDQTISLGDRVALANLHRQAFFVSIHFNSALTPRASGVETFYSGPKSRYAESVVRHRLGWDPDTPLLDGRGPTFGRQVQRRVIEALGARDRGVKNEPGFAVTAQVVGPAILIECGFLANPTEARVIREEGYREKIAQAICEGIEAYLRISEGNAYALVHREDRLPE